MIREVALLVLLSSVQAAQNGDGAAAQSTSVYSGPPTIVLRPDTTTAGQTIAVSGRGFTPNWTAWVFSPDFGDEMCCFMTSPTGSFNVSYALPSDLQPGAYTIRGVDQKGGVASATMTVVSQASSTSTVPEFPGSASALVLVATLVAGALCSTNSRPRGRPPGS
jgi:hypothetical protein